MVSIRHISSGLLLLLFALHLYLGIITMPDSSYVMYLVFGIIYFALGMLFLSKFRYAELLGLIITSGILFIYPAIVNLKYLNPWSSGVMGAIDAILIICCLLMLLLKL
jgi:hypothetical protein